MRFKREQAAIVGWQLFQGSGYFFHGKMPGCCLPSLTAATALHFTHLNKNRRRVLPFSAAIALCPLEAPGRSSCREKNTPTPQLFLSSLKISNQD
jgi:hypothetical protein